MPLRADRFFNPEPRQLDIALALYATVKDLPLVCPHGHVDPALFASADQTFGSPAELLIIPDHYVFRMLYSQGVSLEALGIPARDGTPGESDHRKIWQVFADHFYLFRGTPTGVWLTHELEEVFGITDKLTGANAQPLYDHIADCLSKPEYSPRALYKRFNIEVLSTTDAAADTLDAHRQIQQDWPEAIIRPAFRPDAAVNIDMPGWRSEIDRLSAVSGITITDYSTYIAALENRRAFFKTMGARSTDHGVTTAYTEALNAQEADAIFQRALSGTASTDDARRFTGHMLIEMARMSTEDSLTMQIHIGSYRNHNATVFDRFGTDKGADIPIASEFTRNLRPLLERHGNNPGLRIVLFTLDETVYARELAPLAGHYPALRIGPPWWFHDSLNGMARYFDQIMETAGLYNTAGFIDDTRAFPSIPARHDVWRRAACNWIAGLVARGLIDMEDGYAMARAASYDLAKETFNL